MHLTMCEIDHQFKFHAGSRALKAGALGQPRGIRRRRRLEGGSERGDTCIPVADLCQRMAKNDPNIVK